MRSLIKHVRLLTSEGPGNLALAIVFVNALVWRLQPGVLNVLGGTAKQATFGAPSNWAPAQTRSS